MLHPTDEIRGEHLTAFDDQLQAEIYKHQQRNSVNRPDPEWQIKNGGIKTNKIAGVILAAIGPVSFS